MAERKHYSKLPPIQGFTRIPDRESTSPRTPGLERMLRCDACGEEIPSLGVGYHKQGRPCTVRAAEKRAKAGRKKTGERLSDSDVDALVQVNFENALAQGEAWAEEAHVMHEAAALIAGDRVDLFEIHPMDLLAGDVLLKRDGHETPRYKVAAVERWDDNSARLTIANVEYPFLYIEHVSILTVVRAA